MKKMLTSLLSLLLIFSMAVPALAAEEAASNDFIVIDVASDEEAQALLAEIEENNQRAQALWEAAVLQAEEERAEYEACLATIQMKNLAQPKAVKTVNVRDSQKVPGSGFPFELYSHFYHSAKYDVVTVSGTPIIVSSSISGVNTYKENSNSSVTGRTGNYVIIDSGRTLAVSSSMRVGVKDSKGVWYYTHIDRYVEFYNSFSGRVL